jgi:hypothetical protein
MDTFAGSTESETSAGALTVNVVVALIEPTLARMTVLPGVMLVARPAGSMEAIAGAEEFHVAEVVRFWVLPSVNVPVAVNCCPAPSGTDGFAGVSAIETSVAAPTVSVADCVTVPRVAVIAAAPWPELVASPLLPGLLLITATRAFEVLHVTFVVMSLVLASV